MDTWTLPQTQIVIINYEKFGVAKGDQLVKDILKRKFDCIVLDEAHRIKNRNAKVSIRIQKLRGIPKRLCLTGTPAHNHPEDIFNILRFLHPATHTSYWKWLDEWFEFEDVYTRNGTVKKPAGIKRSKQDEFVNALDKYCTMRKRSDVMDWDTTIPVVDIPLPTNKKQQAALDKLMNTYCVGDIECIGILDQLTYYRQLCNIPEILGLSIPSPKVDWVMQYIKDNPDESVVIFSDSRKSLEILARHLPAGLITGKVTVKDRAKLVSDFQSGQIKYLLCQTQACKEGLTLDRADTEIFFDVYPPLSDFLQAKDRIVPVCVEHSKDRVCYRLYMADTYDEALVRLVDNNFIVSDVINNFKRYLK